MSTLPSQELALGIVQHCPEAMLVVDPDTSRIVEANLRACKLLGYARDEITCRNIADIESSIEERFYWEEVKGGHCAELDAMRGGYRRRDGSTILVEKSLVKLRIAGRALLLITFHGVAGHGALDEELARSSALLRATLEATADGLLVTCTDGSISNMNHRFTRMWNIPDALLEAGDDENIFAYMRGCIMNTDDHALQGAIRQRGKNGFAILHLKDGRCFERYVTPLHFNGWAGGQVFSFRDISARIADEAARRTLEAQLRESQKMEAVGTLAGGIAHDFNNILAAILGNVSLARMELEPDHAALASLEEIDKASKRARDLVQQILTFSRRQTQELVIQPLRPLVDESIKLLRAIIPAGVIITASYDDAPLYVRADATQIEQVLMNLCTNAWHAMKSGSGRIELALREVFLDQDGVREFPELHAGRYVRLCVSDNGCGMDQATQAHIFEPFFTTKRVGAGTGLGLSVVHGIVKTHRGAIKVESAPGKGTAVVVCLPVAAAPVQAAPPVPAPNAVQGSGQHILYLDDDEALVSMMQRVLTRLGYRASGHIRGQDALDAVRAAPHQFDLVVTDFNMPGLSGLDVAKELRGLSPDLPVVIFSGYITDDLRADAQQAGVRQVFAKANTVEDMCKTIHQLLSVEPGKA